MQAPPSKLIELLHRSPEIVDRIQNQARDLYMEERQTKQDECQALDPLLNAVRLSYFLSLSLSLVFSSRGS